MLKLLEINYREIANLANVVEQPFDDIVSNYREKDQSRVTMLMHVRAKAREIIEMFSFARQESTTTTRVDTADLPAAILIGRDRGRIEHTFGLIIDQSEMLVRADVIVVDRGMRVR